ncbi:MAG: hypothetical protein H6726_22940 [Sandaracinaceae bacterium]|nr:hypothetical protein [Sandaracinaceae bacterium]
MMVVDGQNEIRTYMKRFRRMLIAAATERGEHWIGFPGGRRTAQLYVLRERGIWLANIGELENRYFNAFGHVMPEDRQTLPIDVEINVPLEGIDRRVAAVFLRDARGKLYIGHRGKIGGGRPGVGPELFWSQYRNQAANVMDGEEVNPVVVLGALDDPRLVDSVVDFVHRIAEIKRVAHEPESTSPREEDHAPAPFVPEFEGSKTIRGRDYHATWHHGVVVRQLEAELRKRGYETSNDRARDLVARKGRTEIVFEVKTSAATQSVYTGVGQLVFGAPRRGSRGQRAVLVIPDSYSPDLAAALGVERIEVVGYRWHGETVEFSGLPGRDAPSAHVAKP